MNEIELNWNDGFGGDEFSPEFESTIMTEDEFLPEFASTAMTEIARENLRQTVSRIENLEENKAEVSEQIKEVYAESKAFGFDTKALRALIKARKIERAEREEQEMMLNLYLEVTGDA
jgi:uncharacterized protein (UPF0335 family)